MTPTTDCQTSHYYVDALIDERYRLEKFIGAGGMACVYKAREEGAPHTYAIKFLRESFHNEDYLVDFFRDEASSMRDLAHPNIVRFYRFVHTEVYSYIVMDYIEGFSLSDVIKRMYKLKIEIPLDEVVRIMTQVARALDTIHREGYVHRDVKPSNVLIERQTGQTYLTDLGITAASNTRIEGAGTVAYMSPETIETGVADHRADIYSYAIMFYELLAKRRPFNPAPGLRGQAAEKDLVNKHRQAPVPQLTDRRPDLPTELNDIMRQALAKNPGERYQDIMTLAVDLHSVLKAQLSADLQDFSAITARQIEAPDATNVSQPSTVNRPNLLPYLLVAGLLVLVLLGSLLSGGLLGAPALDDGATIMPAAAATSTAIVSNIADQPRYNLIIDAEALVSAQNEQPLALVPAADAPLQLLRIGTVEGFEATMVIGDADGIDRYGVAFYLQDDQAYMRFTIEPQTLAWTVLEVIAGTTNVIASGQLDDAPGEIVVTGLDDAFQVRAGDRTLLTTTGRFDSGSLALWVEGDPDGRLVVDALTVSLLGTEATLARTQTPTPVPALVEDPLQPLLDDIDALLATNDVARSSINCPEYIEIYNDLDRHLVETNTSEIRQFAQDILDGGEVVFARCLAESPNTPLVFSNAIRDYLDWEMNLRELRDELTNTDA